MTEPTTKENTLAALMRAAEQAKGAPLEKWSPEDCGDIDMSIDAHGVWHYLGSPIKRPAMVKLFASVLARESSGRYVLVTPVEKVGIQVEDAPFIAVEMFVNRPEKPDAADQVLAFRTNVDDWITVGPDHLISLPEAAQGEPDAAFVPYLNVRRGLKARLTRTLALDLANLLFEHHNQLGFMSSGSFHTLQSVKAV